ncbi:MAG: DUF4965 domain-containing protein [Clostridia bacterium]|nr:DUF4965 domain-containing protein [Clostridia bacterium]
MQKKKEDYIMKLRAPSIPLITVDPYFSVWAPNEKLNFKETQHWTGAKNDIHGYVIIDGEELSFLGYYRNIKKIPQTSLEIDALSTKATFENDKIKLTVRFMTPLLPDDLDLLTRPVSYMAVSYEKKDESVKDVSVKVLVGDSLCLNRRNEKPTVTESVKLDGITAIKMGNEEQNLLNRSGDDLRIDWGYVWLAVCGEAETEVTKIHWIKHVAVTAPVSNGEEKLFMFAYDDCAASINYFGKQLKSYWNKDGKTIEAAIEEAAKEYSALTKKCDAFAKKMFEDAENAGGEKYAEILSLAYRQVIAAHKLVLDDNGDILYISKECFSNGCAATVDVSYPSIPLYLYYNPELIKGMLRPVYKFAATDAWKYDFAPHDVGQYPLVTGQVYGLDRATGELLYEKQMPVEECGNMIIMETNVAIADGTAEFAKPHMDVLRGWCEYLIKYGDDPENQLCTDDFAGHLAHNCNLTLKAIMGIMGMSILCDMLGEKNEAEKYAKIAKEKADSWCERAENADGSYKLAFDKEGSYSMKYNMVWDKIWGTNLFDEKVYKKEIASNISHFNEYGLPLDSRCDQTKSDWLVWTATMAKNQAEFKKFITPLWNFYNETPDRVPMTDWYDTVAGTLIGFIHRTVQGGLFIKMLDESKKLNLNK